MGSNDTAYSGVFLERLSAYGAKRSEQAPYIYRPNELFLIFTNRVLTTFFTSAFRSWITKPDAPAGTATFFAAVLAVSMALSPFLLSISMWGLVFTAFWHLERVRRQEQYPRPWWTLPGRSFQSFFRQPEYAFFMLLLLTPAISGLWSDDQAYWLTRTRVRLPFLVLPWAFANLPRLSGRQLRLVLYLLVWLMVVLCAGVGINYRIHQDAILEALQQGRSIPVPRNHIRFSLMLATAVIAGGWLWRNRFVLRFAWERHALAAATFFLFIFLHFLSVRSGLAAFYLAIFFTLARFIWRTRRWKLGLAAVLFLIVAPWAAVKTLPSLAHKLAYSRYDWERYRENEGGAYSDAGRWVSLQSGYLVWEQNKWLGAGAGDLPAAVRQAVQQHFPAYQTQPKLPHNQFLYILASTGLFGLALSLAAFLCPVFVDGFRKHYLFAAFQVMIFASFLVEYTIETAMGVAWYLFYTLWFMQIACKQKNLTDSIS